MKLKTKITKDVIDRSLYCETPPSLLPKGVEYISSAATHCGIAVTVRDLFPKARIYTRNWSPFGSVFETRVESTSEMITFVEEFDNYKNTPEKRYSLVGKEFEIDVPDWVIEKIGISQVKEILAKSETLELI